MATDRQIAETVARLVATIVYYQNDARSPGRPDLMLAEVQVLAAWVAELGLDPIEVDLRILRPAGAELYARFGPEVAPRLDALIVEGFDRMRRQVEEAASGPVKPADRAGRVRGADGPRAA